MKKLFSFILLFSFLSTQGAKASINFDTVDRLMETAISRKHIPGAVLLIAKDGQIIKNTAYKHRMTVPEYRPAELNTIYDLASVTQPVATAYSILKLWENGRLDLNERVHKYIPCFTEGLKRNVTIRQLLIHSSGQYAGLNFFKK